MSIHSVQAILSIHCGLGVLLVRFGEHGDEWDRDGPSPPLDYCVQEDK